MTEDVIELFNKRFSEDLTPIFDQYLRHTKIPALELKFDVDQKTIDYRWQVDEPHFAMPVQVGDPQSWQIIRPTTQWQSMKLDLAPDDFKVATELYYINVVR
jgi:aminopeptidase N